MSYAIKECDSCHIELPANAMHAHTRNRQTGHSRTSYSGSSNSRTTNHYRREDYFLCPPCHEARRRGQMILAALAAVAILVFYVADALNKPSTPPPAAAVEPTGAAEPVDLLEGVDLESVDTVSPDPIETAEPVAIETEETAGIAPEHSDVERTGEEAEHITGEAPPERFERDIQSALSSGEPRLWRGDGETGYVVPSELQSGVSARCRTFVVTAIEGRSQRQLQAGERCLDEGTGEWLPR